MLRWRLAFSSRSVRTRSMSAARCLGIRRSSLSSGSCTPALLAALSRRRRAATKLWARFTAISIPLGRSAEAHQPTEPPFHSIFAERIVPINEGRRLDGLRFLRNGARGTRGGRWAELWMSDTPSSVSTVLPVPLSPYPAGGSTNEPIGTDQTIGCTIPALRL